MPDKPGFKMTAPADVYRRRRAALAASLGRPLVIFAGHAPARNYATNPYPFRANSSYLYFGGPPLEHAAWLIEPRSNGADGCTLLRPPTGPDDALWFGELPGDADVAAAAGVPEDRLAYTDKIEQLLAGRETAAVVPPFPTTIASAARLGLHAPTPDELLAIINQRLLKDEHELAALRYAADVGMEAHRAALAAVRPGGREAEVAAAFIQVLHQLQCRPSFSPIITVRGEILHNEGHPHELTAGQLLLIDAGAEEPGGYASDITRTVPVSGKWTEIQRHLYETVRRALNEASAACTPGTRFRDVHDLSARVICEGLVAADLLRGEPANLVARTAHALFYPHGVGHLLGLDGHDMEDFGDLAGYAPGRERRPEFGNKYLRLDRDLEPGMCVTIEPGIYLVPAIWTSDELVGPLADVVNRKQVDALLRDGFGGIRLEHDVHVRVADAGGPEILSNALPTAPDVITACINLN
ncbi:MAG: aminopeptidase P N-terminal domain-containing protein [Planctomycetes bacterium]|nr:aminopeptidase P N-terminal domain-containing protein [Planctomycetota bacterium]